ncbi:MAG: TolB-like 6-bladed beta-propeller domain-containing protein [Dysgonamonadaceae bacterium]|jgi:hypothetical protein|nr:TolB-like 6-bladed beta-propeller domain-containing protein [Dysgonamonadaceae bacterium]
MIKKILILLTVSIAFVSCQEKRDFLLTDYFPEIQVCKLQKMKEYPVDSIGHADFIFSHGDYLLLSEPKLDYLISLYNTTSKNFTRLLKKGESPDQLLDVQQIGRYKNEDSLLFVKSTFGKDIFTYTLGDDSLVFHKKIQMAGDNVSLFFDGDKTVVSQHGEKRFAVHDAQEESAVEFGDSIVMGDCPQKLVSYILTGLCTGNKNLKRFVWASIYGDIFEIYDYKNPLNVKTVASIRGILPMITVTQNQPVFSVESKLGIVSITATSQYIYMLYNENHIKDFLTQREDALLSDKILVYDWDGNPQKIIQTDKRLRSISCNEKLHKIYCLGVDNEGNAQIFFIRI